MKGLGEGNEVPVWGIAVVCALIISSQVVPQGMGGMYVLKLIDTRLLTSRLVVDTKSQSLESSMTFTLDLIAQADAPFVERHTNSSPTCSPQRFQLIIDDGAFKCALAPHYVMRHQHDVCADGRPSSNGAASLIGVQKLTCSLADNNSTILDGTACCFFVSQDLQLDNLSSVQATFNMLIRRDFETSSSDQSYRELELREIELTESMEGDCEDATLMRCMQRGWSCQTDDPYSTTNLIRNTALISVPPPLCNPGCLCLTPSSPLCNLTEQPRCTADTSSFLPSERWSCTDALVITEEYRSVPVMCPRGERRMHLFEGCPAGCTCCRTPPQ